jgi:hypothetical protein
MTFLKGSLCNTNNPYFFNPFYWAMVLSHTGTVLFCRRCFCQVFLMPATGLIQEADALNLKSGVLFMEVFRMVV